MDQEIRIRGINRQKLCPLHTLLRRLTQRLVTLCAALQLSSHFYAVLETSTLRAAKTFSHGTAVTINQTRKRSTSTIHRFTLPIDHCSIPEGGNKMNYGLEESHQKPRAMSSIPHVRQDHDPSELSSMSSRCASRISAIVIVIDQPFTGKIKISRAVYHNGLPSKQRISLRQDLFCCSLRKTLLAVEQHINPLLPPV